jgi:hypothetical protein
MRKKCVKLTNKDTLLLKIAQLELTLANKSDTKRIWCTRIRVDEWV